MMLIHEVKCKTKTQQNIQHSFHLAERVSSIVHRLKNCKLSKFVLFDTTNKFPCICIFIILHLYTKLRCCFIEENEFAWWIG